jgi:glycine hydroxymethyltransferase
MVPFDDKSPFVTSGMRIGTAAVTTRGLKENDMERIVELIDKALADPENEQTIKSIKEEVNQWMLEFPLFSE